MKKIIGFIATSVLAMTMLTSTAQAELDIYSVVTITETGSDWNPFVDDSATGASVALGMGVLPSIMSDLSVEVELGYMGGRIDGGTMSRGGVYLVADPMLFKLGSTPVHAVVRGGYSLINLKGTIENGFLFGAGLGFEVTDNISLIVDYRRQFSIVFKNSNNTLGVGMKYNF